MVLNRMAGPYAPQYWSLIACNVVLPQVLWIKKVRSSPAFLFVVSLIVNLGMWLERYIIIVTSLHRDFLPSAWGTYSGTIWDVATLVGTLGLFLALMFLFIRCLPVFSLFAIVPILPG